MLLYVWNGGGLSNDSKGVGPQEILDGDFKWHGGMGSGPEFECPTNFPSPSPHLPTPTLLPPKLQFVVPQS